MLLKHPSIRVKIILLLTLVSVAALLLASAAFVWNDRQLLLQAEQQKIDTMGKLLAAQIKPLLRAGEASKVHESLQLLGIYPAVKAALLKNAQGETLATYRRSQAISAVKNSKNIHGLQSFMGQKGKVFQLDIDLEMQVGLFQDLTNLYGILAAMIVGVLLIIAWVSLLLQRWVSKPAHAIAMDVFRIRESGDYTQRLSEKGSLELLQLSKNINMMLMDVERQYAQSSMSNEKMEKKVAARTKQLQKHVDALQRSEDNLDKIMQAMERAGEAVSITDAQGKLEYINPAFSRVTGYEFHDLKGVQGSVLVAAGLVTEDMMPKIQNKALFGDVWEGERLCSRKGGEKYPALLSVAAICDKKNTVSHYVTILRDCSDRSNLEEQLRQAQKMEAVGVLVGGIAHDFNNLLAGIIGSLELAKHDIREPDKALGWLDDIESISHRAAETISKLLAFARKDRVEMKPLSVNDFLTGVERLAKVGIRADVEVKVRCSAAKIWVSGDENQLQQVLLNLLNNAVDAMDFEAGKRSWIAIDLTEFEASTEFRSHHPNITAQRFACLKVRDNGCGFDAEVKAKIFEPFFTTKVVGKGTGLGLSMAYGIIERHGGVMEVDSVPDKGAEFRIYLPCTSAPEGKAAKKHDGKMPHGKGELILLADDEQVVRDMGVRLLERLEYRVIVAEDGLEAVRLFEKHQQEIGMVILDLVMPRMGGTVVAKKMRALRKDLPILFVTGYDLNSTLIDAQEIVGAEVLTKPYSLNDFSRAVYRMVDAVK